MSSPYGSILAKLAERQILVPYIETALMSEEWPDSYQVTVDSSPYYGKVAPDGRTNLGGSGDGYAHPSTHPLMGARELYYHFHPDHFPYLVHDPWTLQSIMTVTMGSAMHAIVQTQAQMLGMLSEENTEVEFVDDVRRVRGRIDMIINHPQHGLVPVEMKTANPRVYEAADAGPQERWDIQISIALDQLGFDWGILFLLETGWPYRMRELRIDKNRRAVDEFYQKLDEVWRAIEADTPPPRCCSLNSPKMKKCAARLECWGEMLK